MWERQRGNGRRPQRAKRANGIARAKPAGTDRLRTPAAGANGRRVPRRWTAMIRWFLVRPVRLWWTQGWAGRLAGRWFGGVPAAPEQATRGMQQR